MHPDSSSWNVIWQIDPEEVTQCIERDWFRELFALVPIASVHVDYDAQPLLNFALPRSIICASCPNRVSQDDLIRYLQKVPRPRVLYHISDEFLDVGSEVYEYCDLVIRNGSARFELLGNPALVQVPLGFVRDLGNPGGTVESASRRAYSFAFMGSFKRERGSSMIPALQQIPGQHLIRQTRTYKEATDFFNESSTSVYRNAVFVPNPKGNWNPECNRLYDAMEWGCIPLIKRYPDSEYHRDYHDRLLGNHPIPTFDEWSEAASFATALLADAAALDELQETIVRWWQDYKAGLRTLIAEKLRGSSTHEQS